MNILPSLIRPHHKSCYSQLLVAIVVVVQSDSDSWIITALLFLGSLVIYTILVICVCRSSRALMANYHHVEVCCLNGCKAA